ncbi:hypothetical protein MLD38_000565 [Melastoma candidum]|uniref:Uncharacterized protein n=1 Tax=Melastoma candidum TaxID=119954 RepID=A0ACB9SAL4_9MYRT|nr:hypothetical protein MLD38_000565 [Melastoma candidum]
MDEHQNFPKLEKLSIEEGRLINFPCFMSSMPELREMILENSVIAEISSQCATAALLFPRLEELNMAGCNSTEFPFFLSRSEGLRTLDLSGNKVRVIPDWF